MIVSWNGREDTVRAVEACLLQSGAGEGRRENVEITVVDNGSTDGIRQAVERRFPTVRVIRLEENRGFTGGVMAAARGSAADLLIFLNNDAIPEPGWLGASLDALAGSDPDVVAAAGKIVDPSGTKADFVRGVMTFDGHGFQPGYGRSLEEIDEAEPGTELFFACGGNMVVRRREFLELGGFDDDFFAYLEDVDFGWRSWQAGYRTVWNPAAVVRHRSSSTSNRLGAFERGVLFERNAIQMVMKNLDDEMLGRLSGPIFLTMLHRLHRYSTERNTGAGLLSRPPLDAPGSGKSPRSGKATIDDPLTVMQFRAVEWFFAHNDRIMDKRVRVQANRRVPDREIFARFPPFVVPTYHGDDRLFSSKLFEALWPDVAKESRALEDMNAG